jgi:SAM domain (Sterile alpha motif)
VQEVADWLKKLGMSEYAQRFAENDIDALVLPHLTDQSLKELGVSLGHRLKILAAIKNLAIPRQRLNLLLRPKRSRRTPPSAAK